MKILPLLAFVLPAQTAFAQPSGVLVTVDGKAITRQEVADRVWNDHADETLNRMVDDLLVGRALAAFESKSSKKDLEARRKESERRLAALRSRFKDEASFAESLKRSQTDLETLRRQIENQVKREAYVVAARGLAVSGDDARQFFEANKGRLGTQEAVLARHLAASSEQQARDLLTALRVGADFARLARELSADAASKEKGGSLGFVTRGVMAPEIEAVLFALKPGEISEVIKTPSGYHIFKVEERRAAKAAEFKAVEDDIRRALLAQRISDAWPAQLAELRKKAKIVPAPGVTAGSS